MNKINQNLQTVCQQITTAIQNLLIQKKPIIVALDGGSGAGKSTLAGLIADKFETALIPLDDFFSADIPDAQWDKFSVEEKLKNVFDWKQLRQHVIEPLLKGKIAKWHTFDFQSKNPNGSYQMQTTATERFPANVILLDGAYSGSPEISDLIDLAILIDVTIAERHKRLIERENDKDFLEKWHERWDEVENYYFSQVRPKVFFDLTVEFL